MSGIYNKTSNVLLRKSSAFASPFKLLIALIISIIVAGIVYIVANNRSKKSKMRSSTLGMTVLSFIIIFIFMNMILRKAGITL